MCLTRLPEGVDSTIPGNALRKNASGVAMRMKIHQGKTPQLMEVHTVVPVMNGHPRDQEKVSVHCRWPLIRGNLTLKGVGRGIDNVAVQGRWPLTTGVAQGRYVLVLL